MPPSDAETNWSEISAQLTKEAEYNTPLVDTLKGILNQINEEVFPMVEDEDALSEDGKAEIYHVLDDAVDNLGWVIDLLA